MKKYQGIPQPFPPVLLRIAAGKKKHIKPFTVFPMIGDILLLSAFAAVFFIDGNFQQGCCGNEMIISPNRHPVSPLVIGFSMGTKALLFATSLFLHQRIVRDGTLRSLHIAYLFGDTTLLRSFMGIFDLILVVFGFIDLGSPEYLSFYFILGAAVLEFTYSYLCLMVNRLIIKMLQETIARAEIITEIETRKLEVAYLKKKESEKAKSDSDVEKTGGDIDMSIFDY
uniref:7TM_GPCR_Srx domain-containing protein n=1 Tax=Caenorhabditis tropicalis TaxID=1561998 RepID=A0A1I7U7R4_9PELO